MSEAVEAQQVEAQFDQQAQQQVEQGTAGFGQPSDIAPKNAMPDEIAQSLSSYDIKNVDLTNMGIDSLSGKYKTVAELEKGYQNLQSRFGSFTGAPEDYEIAEDANVDGWVTEWAKESNLSQDGFNSLIGKYNEHINAQQEAYKQEQLGLLGDKAGERLDSLRDWGKANGIDAGTMDAMFSSADAVQALEALRKGSGVQAPVEQQAQAPIITKSELVEMTNKKDEHGRLLVDFDVGYRNKLQKLWEQVAS